MTVAAIAKQVIYTDGSIKVSSYGCVGSGENLIHDTKRLAVTALFGVIIFVTKTLAPSPINKMLIGVHAFVIAIGALLAGKWGATFVSLIEGILTASWNIALAPFTLIFSLSYGLLVDLSFSLFRVNAEKGEVKTGRLIISMTVSTMLVGFMSYYVTVHQLELMPRSLPLEAIILFVGTASGALAGYFASLFWNKHLRNVKF